MKDAALSVLEGELCLRVHPHPLQPSAHSAPHTLPRPGPVKACRPRARLRNTSWVRALCAVELLYNRRPFPPTGGSASHLSTSKMLCRKPCSSKSDTFLRTGYSFTDDLPVSTWSSQQPKAMTTVFSGFSLLFSLEQACVVCIVSVSAYELSSCIRLTFKT